MTKHLTAEDRREQIAEILVTGIFRVLADRATHERPTSDKWQPARIELPEDPKREAEPCH
jgi:hypothetical protein